MAPLNTRRPCLRTDSPKDNHCSLGTLLHFSLQNCPLEYLLLPPRSALKAVPPRLTAPRFCPMPTPFLHHEILLRADGRVSVRASAIHFQG